MELSSRHITRPLGLSSAQSAAFPKIVHKIPMEQKTMAEPVPKKQTKQIPHIQKTVPQQGDELSTNSQTAEERLPMDQTQRLLEEKIQREKMEQAQYWKALYKVKFAAFEQFCMEQDGDNPYTTEEESDYMDETEDETEDEEIEARDTYK